MAAQHRPGGGGRHKEEEDQAGEEHFTADDESVRKREFLALEEAPSMNSYRKPISPRFYLRPMPGSATNENRRAI